LEKLHNEELPNLYTSPSIIRVKKSRKMRWAGHVARIREKRNAYRILVGKPVSQRKFREDNLIRPRTLHIISVFTNPPIIWRHIERNTDIAVKLVIK
jgi:hypothetical protein